jgi:hypothetical protein
MVNMAATVQKGCYKVDWRRSPPKCLAASEWVGWAWFDRKSLTFMLLS